MEITTITEHVMTYRIFNSKKKAEAYRRETGRVNDIVVRFFTGWAVFDRKDYEKQKAICPRAFC